jgi:hypothetical protein
MSVGSHPPALTELQQVVDGFFMQPAAVTALPPLPPAPLPPTVLPFLRHLGGNLAEADALWQTLIQSHPVPKRAVILEVH